ncbi:hypothetical protein FNV43_RR08842 [Rhamnella rubrinervis]|uniref:Uncharacterized protein n=1 Tax=Rhamnella rubrinervis TaxID=2594499 RepID=A0A8K0MJA8_9ROSA|nr:hypothetical protein FNV43_RR08842 [Rhamnella rubrinervis]
MEELVHMTRVQQQRNEVQEQINRHLLEAFNVVKTPPTPIRTDLPQQTKRAKVLGKGKIPVRAEERTESRAKVVLGGRCRVMHRAETLTRQTIIPSKGEELLGQHYGTDNVQSVCFKAEGTSFPMVQSSFIAEYWIIP